MKAPVTTLDNGSAGEVDLSDAIFGLEARSDLLHRVVTWQLANRRSGTHKTKTTAEVSGTGAKMYRQKGTGRARHGHQRANMFRGGAVAWGPRLRSHAEDLPKKVRKLGLKMALSAKQAEGKLAVLDVAKVDGPKTKALAAKLKALGWTSVLIIDGAELDTNMVRAARNLPGIDLLPEVGANVYDILRRDRLVLTKAAIERLEARLK